MPMGDTVYIMRKNIKPIAGRAVQELGSIELWAPLTGECYFFTRKESVEKFLCVPLKKDSYMEIRLNDPLCPLKHVFSIVAPDNIYANI